MEDSPCPAETSSHPADESIGGVSGFEIVPIESANTYHHNGPLPQGAVQGLAWTTGSNAVQLATNRNNKLATGHRHIVFLEWSAETVPVAVLDLPSTDHDYEAALPARLHMTIPSASQAAPSASQPAPPLIGVKLVNVDTGNRCGCGPAKTARSWSGVCLTRKKTDLSCPTGSKSPEGNGPSGSREPQVAGAVSGIPDPRRMKSGARHSPKWSAHRYRKQRRHGPSMGFRERHSAGYPPRQYSEN